MSDEAAADDNAVDPKAKSSLKAGFMSLGTTTASAAKGAAASIANHIPPAAHAKEKLLHGASAVATKTASKAAHAASHLHVPPHLEEILKARALDLAEPMVDRNIDKLGEVVLRGATRCVAEWSVVGPGHAPPSAP